MSSPTTFIHAVFWRIKGSNWVVASASESLQWGRGTEAICMARNLALGFVLVWTEHSDV